MPNFEYDKLSDEVKAEIDFIVNKHSVKRTEITDYFNEVYNRKYLNSATTEEARLEWASRILKSEFEDKAPKGKKDFIVLGKGPIQYSKGKKTINSFLLVLDANNRELKTLVLSGKTVKHMDTFQCGELYKEVMVGVGKDGTLFGDETMIPIPQGTPAKQTVPEILKKIKVKEVSFGALMEKGNMTQVGSAGWPVRTDLRCFRNLFVVRSWSGEIKEWTDFDVKRGNMYVKDDRDGFDESTDNDGLVWSNKITFWGNEQFLYPKHSVVNIWGVVSRNRESKDLNGEIMYVQPIFIAEDTEDS